MPAFYNEISYEPAEIYDDYTGYDCTGCETEAANSEIVSFLSSA